MQEATKKKAKLHVVGKGFRKIVKECSLPSREGVGDGGGWSV